MGQRSHSMPQDGEQRRWPHPAVSRGRPTGLFTVWSARPSLMAYPLSVQHRGQSVARPMRRDPSARITRASVSTASRHTGGGTDPRGASPFVLQFLQSLRVRPAARRTSATPHESNVCFRRTSRAAGSPTVSMIFRYPLRVLRRPLRLIIRSLDTFRISPSLTMPSLIFAVVR